MNPLIQITLTGLLFAAAALGVHWFFMRDYNRSKRRD
jgi:hypothetical protein